MNMLKRSFVSE